MFLHRDQDSLYEGMSYNPFSQINTDQVQALSGRA